MLIFKHARDVVDVVQHV